MQCTCRFLPLAALLVSMTAFASESSPGNPGFESGQNAPWNMTANVAVVKDGVHAGDWVLRFADGGGEATQRVTVRPGMNYRLRAWVRSGSGAEVVEIGIKEYGGSLRSVASPLVSWNELTLNFATPALSKQATIFLKGQAEARIDDIRLDLLGPVVAESAGPEDGNSIFLPAPRIPATEMGITQLSNERMNWLLDQRYGMFIHWGLYAGMGKNEWVMNNQGISPEKYQNLAYPESGEKYFSADRYSPQSWAQLAKDAGMKWLCLTARHHDGYSLYDVPHPNAFTSMQTHKRDFIAEYVTAVREAGLGVGLYYSPLSWRYPGYFDVTGTDCKPNRWNYRTDPAHRENARLMKEENYVAVKTLMTKYGHIDHIYWDGGWLGLQGSDADAAFFHEPGRYLDPQNAWPIGQPFQDIDPASGRPLGIMGMVRRYQPEAITNYRYGWRGDLWEEEGSATITGGVRESTIVDKNLSIHSGGWGYIPNAPIMSKDAIIRMLADCTIRNMTMLLNVGPDRHGEIPPAVQDRLREVGAWLGKMGEGIYGTRGGPWNPDDGRLGYARKGDTIYVHILKDYQGAEIVIPPVGPLVPQKAWELYSGKELSCTKLTDRRVQITGIDRLASPADTIVAIRFDKDVLTYAKTRK